MSRRFALRIPADVGATVAGRAASSRGAIRSMERRTQKADVVVGTALSMACVAECPRRRWNMGCRLGFYARIRTVVTGIATVGNHAGVAVYSAQEGYRASMACAAVLP
jgi:hypothetical protein